MFIPALLRAVVALICIVVTSGCGVLFGRSDQGAYESTLWTVKENPKSIMLENPEPVSAEVRVVRDIVSSLSDGNVHPPSGNTDIPLSSFSQIPAHEGYISSLAVTQDGLNIFSGGEDGHVVVTSLIGWVFGESKSFDQKVGKFARTESILRGDRPILALSLSPNQRYLAISQFSAVSIYDLVTRKIVSRLTRIKGRVTAVSWDPKGELIAFGMADGDIYVWNLRRGPAAGRDTLDDLEHYQGDDSPVFSILFHPGGRILFVGQRDGQIDVWRLLRTEREMGLIDDYAVVDEEKEGSEHVRVADLKTRLGDIWLSANGETLYAGAADGAISQWKVRGLVAGEKISVGKEAVLALAGFRLNLSQAATSAGKPSKTGKAGSLAQKHGAAVQQSTVAMLAASTRDQKIKFWCQRGGAQNVSENKAEALSVGQSIHSVSYELVAETELLTTPPGLLTVGSAAPVLWAAEKTGNLLVFDARDLLKSGVWREKIRSCINVSER